MTDIMNSPWSSNNNNNNIPHHGRTPSDLFPVVQDLSDVEYGNPSSCGCVETFGSFQLSDLVLPATVPSSSIWNAFCPSASDKQAKVTNNDGEDDDEGEVEATQSITSDNTASTTGSESQQAQSHSKAQSQDTRTPVKRNPRGQQRDSTPTTKRERGRSHGHGHAHGHGCGSNDIEERTREAPLSNLQPLVTTTTSSPTASTSPTSSTPRANNQTHHHHYNSNDKHGMRSHSDHASASRRHQDHHSHRRNFSDSRLQVDDLTETETETETMHDDSQRRATNANTNTNTINNNHHPDDSHSTATNSVKKVHKLSLRRRSKQLMNMLNLVQRSNSMSSSARDLSTNNSLESASAHLAGDYCSNSNGRSFTFSETYILCKRVFQCRFSEIWECLHRETGIRYCVKVFDRPEDPAVHSELDMMFALTKQTGTCHPNLVQLVEVIAERSKLYAVMEMVGGVNLLSRIVKEGPMEEETVKHVTRSILQGLTYLHTRSVVHGDLQPENILLTNEDVTDAANGNFPQAKIADFGSAVDLEVHDPIGASFGDVGYMPPEMFLVEPYDTQADVWSVGCLVYFMLTGSSPFDETPPNKRNIVTKVLRAEYKFPRCYFQNISRSCKQFISNMIHVDSSVRMTAAEALDHPWLRVEQEEQQFHPRFFHSASRRHSMGNDHSLSPSQCSSYNNNYSSRDHTPDHQRRSVSPYPSSPARSKGSCGGNKHHRRLTSLSKGISKLFFPKEEEQVISSSTSLPPPSSVDMLFPLAVSSACAHPEGGSPAPLCSRKSHSNPRKARRRIRHRRQMTE